MLDRRCHELRDHVVHHLVVVVAVAVVVVVAVPVVELVGLVVHVLVVVLPGLLELVRLGRVLVASSSSCICLPRRLNAYVVGHCVEH